MRTPVLGEQVFVLVDPASNGGEDIAAAQITKVWSDTSINVRVFLDTPHSSTLDSIEHLELFAKQADAQAARSGVHAEHEAAHNGAPANPKHLNFAFWPGTAPVDEKPARTSARGKEKEEQPPPAS